MTTTYYARNRDTILERRRQRRLVNLEADRARHREAYAKTDPRHLFAFRSDRKARVYGRPDDRLDWRAIPEGPWTCHYCGVPCSSWDHVIPLCEGGPNKAHNLVPSCVPCNQARNGEASRTRNRKTECHKGHPYTPENTRINVYGKQVCRTCAKATLARFRQRRKERLVLGFFFGKAASS